MLWSRLTHAMFWFSVLDFKHSRLCWIFLTKFSSSKVLVWLFIELLTVSFILMLLELKIPVFSMCSSLVKSRLLFKFELMPDNELDDKRLLIPMTPFLICWSLNWMKSRSALDAASIRASFFDFPWPTYFCPSTYNEKHQSRLGPPANPTYHNGHCEQRSMVGPFLTKQFVNQVLFQFVKDSDSVFRLCLLIRRPSSISFASLAGWR